MKVWNKIKMDGITIFFMPTEEQLNKLKTYLHDEARNSVLSDKKYSTEEINFLIEESEEGLEINYQYAFGKLTEDCTSFFNLSIVAEDLF